jgi:hypothetical protein
MSNYSSARPLFVGDCDMSQIRSGIESDALEAYELLKSRSRRSQRQRLTGSLLPSEDEDHWNRRGILQKVSKGFGATAATLAGMADLLASPYVRIGSEATTDDQCLAIKWTVNGEEGGTGPIDLLGIPNPKSEASRWSKDV